MRRRRREHSLLLKASKILVSLATSVNLTLSHRRRGAAGSAAPAARHADATSPRREIGVGISPQVEPGVSAGRASIAYVDHGYGSFGSGFGVAGTVLRTWNDPWWTRENATYAGGEVFLWPIVFIGPRLGLFRSVAGNTSPNKWFVSLDFGIGL